MVEVGIEFEIRVLESWDIGIIRVGRGGVGVRVVVGVGIWVRDGIRT